MLSTKYTSSRTVSSENFFGINTDIGSLSNCTISCTVRTIKSDLTDTSNTCEDRTSLRGVTSAFIFSISNARFPHEEQPSEALNYTILFKHDSKHVTRPSRCLILLL